MFYKHLSLRKLQLNVKKLSNFIHLCVCEFRREDRQKIDRAEVRIFLRVSIFSLFLHSKFPGYDTVLLSYLL